MAFYAFFVALSLYITSVYGYQIGYVGQTFYKNPGDSITLDCTIQGNDYDPTRDVLTWEKIQGYGPGEKVTMLRGVQHQGVFANNARFPSVTAEKNGDRYSINPRITGLKLEDTGRYTCKAGNAQLTHTLYIIKPVDEIKLRSYTTGDTRKYLPEYDDKMTFEEGVDIMVECVTKGGMTPQHLEIRDSFSDKFVKLDTDKVNETFQGNVAGMKTPNYQETSSNVASQLVYARDADGQTVSCSAKVANMEDTKKAKSKTIDMRYKPYFKTGDCPKEHELMLGVAGKITCKVMAKPAPTKVYWKASGANIYVQPKPISGGVHEVYLNFKTVSKSDFKNYQLVVENSYGTIMTDITITQGVPSSASALSASFLCLTLLSAILLLKQS